MLNHDERIPNESVKLFEYAKDTQENTRVRFRRKKREHNAIITDWNNRKYWCDFFSVLDAVEKLYL